MLETRQGGPANIQHRSPPKPWYRSRSHGRF